MSFSFLKLCTYWRNWVICPVEFSTFPNLVYWFLELSVNLFLCPWSFLFLGVELRAWSESGFFFSSKLLLRWCCVLPIASPQETRFSTFGDINSHCSAGFVFHPDSFKYIPLTFTEWLAAINHCYLSPFFTGDLQNCDFLLISLLLHLLAWMAFCRNKFCLFTWLSWNIACSRKAG